jgi:hypothetical protein
MLLTLANGDLDFANSGSWPNEQEQLGRELFRRNMLGSGDFRIPRNKLLTSVFGALARTKHVPS